VVADQRVAALACSLFSYVAAHFGHSQSELVTVRRPLPDRSGHCSPSIWAALALVGDDRDEARWVEAHGVDSRAGLAPPAKPPPGIDAALTPVNSVVPAT